MTQGTATSVGDLATLPHSPMARMSPPKVPETPVPALGEEALRSLLKACEGAGFEKRWDIAMIRLLIDTGMRASERVNLRVDDLDLDMGVAVVDGKGTSAGVPVWEPLSPRPRPVPPGPSPARSRGRAVALAGQEGRDDLTPGCARW